MLQKMMIFLVLTSLVPTAYSDCDLIPAEVLPDNMFPSIRFETSMGNVIVELNRMRAPATVNNFLAYVLDGSYTGTIFHRVMPGFVVQGGGYSPDFEERSLRPAVLNESGNGLKNDRGTIAMARFSDPHSATRQFYFNMSDNQSLDPNSRSWGYAVFGSVIEGQDVLDAIAAVETGYSEGLDAPDVPVVPVTLLDVKIVEP